MKKGQNMASKKERQSERRILHDNQRTENKQFCMFTLDILINTLVDSVRTQTRRNRERGQNGGQDLLCYGEPICGYGGNNPTSNDRLW